MKSECNNMHGERIKNASCVHFVTAVVPDALPGQVDAMASNLRQQCERVGI